MGPPETPSSLCSNGERRRCGARKSLTREEIFVTSNPPQRFLNASSSRGLRKSRIVVGFLGCPGGFSELRCKVTMRIMVFANFSRKKIKKVKKIAPLSHFHTFTLSHILNSENAKKKLIHIYKLLLSPLAPHFLHFKPTENRHFCGRK